MTPTLVSRIQRELVKLILRARPGEIHRDELRKTAVPWLTTSAGFTNSVKALQRAGVVSKGPTLRVTTAGELAYADGRLSPSGDRAAWMDVRFPYIGSSDVAAILGQDDWTMPWDVYDRIVTGEWGYAEEESEPGSDLRRGMKQEALALQRWEEVYGVPWETCDMIHHPDYDFIVSDPDALIPGYVEWPQELRENPLWEEVIALSEEGVTGGMEVKVPRFKNFMRMRDEGLSRGYAIQGQHHLWVAPIGYLIYLLYDPGYDAVFPFPVTADAGFQEQVLERLVPKWYEDHVIARKRPQRPAPEPVHWSTKVPGEGRIPEDPDVRDQVHLLRLRKMELDEAQEAYDQTVVQFLRAAKEAKEDHPVLLGDGVKVIRTSTRTQRRFDQRGWMTAVLEAKQSEDPAAALAELNHKDPRFFYESQPRLKVDVKTWGDPD